MTKNYINLKRGNYCDIITYCLKIFLPDLILSKLIVEELRKKIDIEKEENKFNSFINMLE